MRISVSCRLVRLLFVFVCLVDNEDTRIFVIQVQNALERHEFHQHTLAVVRPDPAGCKNLEVAGNSRPHCMAAVASFYNPPFVY